MFNLPFRYWKTLIPSFTWSIDIFHCVTYIICKVLYLLHSYHAYQTKPLNILTSAAYNRWAFLSLFPGTRQTYRTEIFNPLDIPQWNNKMPHCIWHSPCFWADIARHVTRWPIPRQIYVQVTTWNLSFPTFQLPTRTTPITEISLVLLCPSR